MPRRLLLQQRFDFFATFLRCDTQTAYCMDFSKVKQETEKKLRTNMKVTLNYHSFKIFKAKKSRIERNLNCSFPDSTGGCEKKCASSCQRPAEIHEISADGTPIPSFQYFWGFWWDGNKGTISPGVPSPTSTIFHPADPFYEECQLFFRQLATFMQWLCDGKSAWMFLLVKPIVLIPS